MDVSDMVPSPGTSSLTATGLDRLRMAQKKKDVPERKRRFSPKSRTGCITCRIRRIKCGEEKPSCLRCTSTGRKCDGYLPTIPAISRRVQPSSSPLSLSYAEKSAIYNFRTKIAFFYSSSIDVEFWTYDVLQAAEAFAPVRHAATALSEAYITFMVSKTDYHDRLQFTLLQYNKSINILHTCFSKHIHLSRTDKIAILMTILMYTCLCALQGLQSEACLHLRSGLALVQDWGLGILEEEKRSQIKSSPIRNILTIFTRLDAQARVILHTTGKSPFKSWAPHHNHFDEMENSIPNPITKAFSQCEKVYHKVLQDYLSGDAKPFTDTHQHLLRDLDHHFQTLQMIEGVSVCQRGTLRVRQLVIRILIQASLTGVPEYPDIDTCSQEILDLAYQVGQTWGSRDYIMSFCLTGSYIEVLYFVGMHSKDSTIRQTVVQLLRDYNFMEGMWRSTSAADIAAIIINNWNKNSMDGSELPDANSYPALIY